MPSIFRDEPDWSFPNDFNSNAAKRHPSRLQPPARVDLPSRPAGEAELHSLIDSDPVDLGRTSAAVRARPDLEAFALRLASSLALSPDLPAETIEEALIILGRDRLRVLFHAWLVSFLNTEAPPPIARLRPSRIQSISSGANRSRQLTPEMLYLATFHHLLEPAQSRETYRPAGSTEICKSQADDVRSWVNGVLERALLLRLLPLRDPIAGLFPSLQPGDGPAENDGESLVPAVLVPRPPIRPRGFAAEHAASLTHMFERDFISLLPFLDSESSARERTEDAVVAGISAAH